MSRERETATGMEEQEFASETHPHESSQTRQDDVRRTVSPHESTFTLTSRQKRDQDFL